MRTEMYKPVAGSSHYENWNVLYLWTSNFNRFETILFPQDMIQDIYKVHWNIIHKSIGVAWNVGPYKLIRLPGHLNLKLNLTKLNAISISIICTLSGRTGSALAWRSEGRTFASQSVQKVLWFAARIELCNTWSSGGTALCRVEGATSQLDLPSLTPLSVAGCGRLQLGVFHYATSVNYCK